MFRDNNRYNDYYLVNDMEVDDISYEPVKKSCWKRCITIGLISLFSLFLIAFLLVFVVLPIVFMHSITLQSDLIFTHFGLPKTEEHFTMYRLPGYLNKYVTVNDTDNSSNVTLGLWQMLPVELTYQSLHDSSFDYDEALLNSNYSVLIYFHGTGESRSDNTRKYQLLRYYFHVIAFDYRDYADSSEGTLSEKAVINDCIQLYRWVQKRTKAPIYVWGHSLGAAIAAETVAALNDSKPPVQGLVLESAFTNLRDELYAHPWGKVFAWLPWFKSTILDPLYRNGFVFNTADSIVNISCPIMIFHAEDDGIVPFKFGKELYEIASNRSETESISFFHKFEKKLRYDHYFIYQDPYVKYFVMDFIVAAENVSRVVDSF